MMYQAVNILSAKIRFYSDAYIVVKGMLTVTGTNASKKRNKKPTFKNNPLFIHL